ncbi:MAG: ion transporter, partial [Flavobacteriales bacterium]|nr:ion transporter [Flavobacteriales bacterium]
SLVNAIFVDEMTMDNNKELENKIDELNRKVDALLKERGG